jgi:hypothetical protein
MVPQNPPPTMTMVFIADFSRGLRLAWRQVPDCRPREFSQANILTGERSVVIIILFSKKVKCRDGAAAKIPCHQERTSCLQPA